MAGNPKFDAALAKMRAVHEAKSHDYADAHNPYSNFDFAQTVAARFDDPLDHVYATMLGIKVARLGQLLSGKTPKHESIADSFLDLANYVVLWWTHRVDEPAVAAGHGEGVDEWVACGPTCTLHQISTQPPLVTCHCTTQPRQGVVSMSQDDTYGHGV